MAAIRLLDKNTIDQIAAGEVVERPSSVVKELTENAIDAHATAITVEIRDGGTSFIRVTDNGSGILRDEVRTAFLRHSTSKITTAEDLITVETLGFRGEALASIASVARVELITKTRTDLVGVRMEVEGGDEKTFEEIGCPEGTTFIVRDLFYNTPARRKFLKSAATEAGYISELIERLALSHPEISFKYINKGNTVLYTNGNRNLKEVVYGVYGRDIAASLVELKKVHDGISVSGFAAKPEVARGNRAFENYYINGRYIKSSIITKAIEEAYKPFMMQHKYPFVVLFIEAPHELVDVNVHPTKLEVRFSDSELIYRAVFHCVRDALAGKNLIPQVREKSGEKDKPSGKAPEPFEAARRSGAKSCEVLKEIKSALEELPFVDAADAGRRTQILDEGAGQAGNVNAGVKMQIAAGQGDRASDTLRENVDIKNVSGNAVNAAASDKNISAGMMVAEDVTEYVVDASGKNADVKEAPSFLDLKNAKQEELELDKTKEYRIIGQVFATYWMLEWNNSLYIIDQHAAHEKVIYERMVKAYRQKGVITQNLTPPLIVSLTVREEGILKEKMQILQRAGFELENFGGREYAVVTVPTELYGICSQDYFVELLDSLSDSADDGDERIFERLAGMSCKAAIKGNSVISQAEAEALIQQLMELENPFNCPHGRPVIISMTKQELEKKFKRIL